MTATAVVERAARAAAEWVAVEWVAVTAWRAEAAAVLECPLAPPEGGLVAAAARALAIQAMAALSRVVAAREAAAREAAVPTVAAMAAMDGVH
jgi:hypothetical protein